MGSCCWGVSPRGAVPCPFWGAAAPRAMPVSIGTARLAGGRAAGGQPGTHRARIQGGTVQCPVRVPASQLPWFELVRVKLVQELLLPAEASSSVVVIVSVHINYLSYILYGRITAFSTLRRWLARLTVLTSKVTGTVYPMGGLAPCAKISPCVVPRAELLLLSPYGLAAFKSVTFLLPVFVSS